MSWSTRMLDHTHLSPASVDALFDQQLESWRLLREGVEGLGRASSRVVSVGGYQLRACHIPHRIRSTTAEVDEQSIRQRACFLCARNLPAEERALAFDAEFVATCNPYPILPRHLSIVTREHRPQSIVGRAGADFAAMLELARSLPEYLLLYNGPECGASAPDHMHFQACRSARVPVIDHLDMVRNRTIEGFPSNPVVLQGEDRTQVQATFLRLMARLASEIPGGDEPMVNLMAVHESGRWRVLVFPRLLHRPTMFHSGELLWSPGALDLAGIVVLPAESDLERVTPELLTRGFAEVSFDATSTERIARELELE